MHGSSLPSNHFESHQSIQLQNSSYSQPLQNNYQSSQRLLSQSEYQTEGTINDDDSNHHHGLHSNSQQYFMDISASDINFGATVSSDSAVSSPIGCSHVTQIKNSNNQSNSTFFGTTLSTTNQLLSPIIEPSMASNGGVDYRHVSSSNNLQYAVKKFLICFILL